MLNGFWRALVALTALAFLGAAPAQAEWRRAESPNFVVYGTASESRLRERILLLEDFDRLLRFMTSVTAPPAPNKLHVYIVDGSEDLQRLRPVGPHIAGFYTASPHGIAAFVDSEAAAGDNEVLFHEYAHHFMMQYAPRAYPAWYVEGFAEYFMTAEFGRNRIDIGKYSPGRAYSIVQGNWLPIERVLSGQPTGLTREGMSAFYAQSWLMVHYFYSTPERQASLQRYLAAVQSGDQGAALERTTGLSPETLNEELRNYIRRRRIQFRRMERDAAEAPPPVTVTALPRSANDLIVYEAALRIGIEEPNQAAYLQQIRTAAARHAEDPYARRVLAHAELLHGDPAAADRLLDPLLAAAPGDAELMYLKGLRHLIAAEQGEDWETEARIARSWFTRAHRVDENHFQTLYRFAQSMRRERDYVSENTSNVLVLAHQLAPQVAEIRMNAAMLLIARGQTADAERLLRPLADDPHDAALARAAQQLIERARSRPAVPARGSEGARSEAEASPPAPRR